MTLPPMSRSRRLMPVWFLGAVLLWLAAAAIDRRTEVVIESLGDHIRFAVAGTELALPAAIRSVERISLWNAASIATPRVLRWTLVREDGTTDLVGGQDVGRPPSRPAPVGDWWVDGRCPTEEVARRDVAVEGEFTMRLVVSGRTSNEFTVILEGEPGLRFGFRRGLMDSYLVIRDRHGELVDVTTIDPTPAADLGALAAQLMRSAAVACLILGLAALVRNVFKGGAGPTVDPARACLDRKALAAALVLSCVAGLVSAVIATRVLGSLPHQIDEVVYLLQARWLLDGSVAPAASEIQEHLRVPFTYVVDGRWVGHYPAGWPALLAVGLAAGAPHLVAPVFGALLVLLAFLVGRELDDDLTGLAAAALATTSSLLRLLAATHFPHLACAVLVMTALWLLLLARRRPGWWLGAGAGLAMGCCLAVRPMPAVAVSLVLGGWLVWEAAIRGAADRWRITGAAIAAGLVTSLPTLAHNAATTGSVLSLPYSLATGAMYAPELVPFGMRNLDSILAFASSGFFGWGWPALTGLTALALTFAFALVPFLTRRARSEDWLLVALLVVVALGHLPTRAHGLHGYGARYLVDVAGCLILLTARGFRELARWSAPSTVAVRSAVAVFVALNLWSLAALPTRVAAYRGYDDVTGQLEEQLDASGASTAVVLVDDERWQPWAEASCLMTGPRRHAIAVGADLGDNSVITRAYPDRPVFHWDGETLRRDDRGGH